MKIQKLEYLKVSLVKKGILRKGLEGEEGGIFERFPNKERIN